MLNFLTRMLLNKIKNPLKCSKMLIQIFIFFKPKLMQHFKSKIQFWRLDILAINNSNCQIYWLLNEVQQRNPLHVYMLWLKRSSILLSPKFLWKEIDLHAKPNWGQNLLTVLAWFYLIALLLFLNISVFILLWLNKLKKKFHSNASIMPECLAFTKMLKKC